MSKWTTSRSLIVEVKSGTEGQISRFQIEQIALLRAEIFVCVLSISVLFGRFVFSFVSVLMIPSRHSVLE